ncbi:hypothetical protein ACFYTC_46250 [Actinomadura nitritigenes]|uniref:hypothetical protein n=1 Tax=Actinomadura nitritigenes TaxID=134602 RepID=UPI003693F869
MTGPVDLGSRAAIERVRLQVATASHALGHWHEGREGSGGRPYTAYCNDAMTAIDAALRALHDVRSALITEFRRDEDARLAENDEFLSRSRAARLDGAGDPPESVQASESDRKP